MTFSTQPTPNPNSLKIVRTDGGPMLTGTPMLTAATLAEAAQHPLTMALFALDGVAGVFALPAFLTITRTPGTPWEALVTQVEAELRQFLAEA
ncbi:MAG: NifU N-terminal domain-containing protein [Rhodothermales bacterium]|nr:NifU N-terminal domain-containing protein [Rhodothermales bacterium]MCA0268964.1 NifU N-terminal domain-containing protein [Bacteroidota bacterium]